MVDLLTAEDIATLRKIAPLEEKILETAWIYQGRKGTRPSPSWILHAAVTGPAAVVDDMRSPMGFILSRLNEILTEPRLCAKLISGKKLRAITARLIREELRELNDELPQITTHLDREVESEVELFDPEIDHFLSHVLPGIHEDLVEAEVSYDALYDLARVEDRHVYQRRD